MLLSYENAKDRWKVNIFILIRRDSERETVVPTTIMRQYLQIKLKTLSLVHRNAGEGSLSARRFGKLGQFENIYAVKLNDIIRTENKPSDCK